MSDPFGVPEAPEPMKDESVWTGKLRRVAVECGITQEGPRAGIRFVIFYIHRESGPPWTTFSKTNGGIAHQSVLLDRRVTIRFKNGKIEHVEMLPPEEEEQEDENDVE